MLTSAEEMELQDLETMEQVSNEVTSQSNLSPEETEELAQLESMEEANNPEEVAATAEKGFIDKSQAKFNDRVNNITEDFSKVADEDISIAEGALRLGGQTAGAMLDVMGEGLVKGLETVGSFDVTSKKGDSVGDFVTYWAKEGWNSLMSTSGGQYAKTLIDSGGEQLEEFKKESPRAYENISQAVNIGLMVAPVPKKKIAPPVKEGESLIGEVGGVIKKAGAKQQKANQTKLTNSIIKDETKAALLLEEKKKLSVGKGLAQEDIAILNARQVEMVEEVSKVKGFNANNYNHMQDNIRAIDSANVKIAESLTKSLERETAPISIAESSKVVNNAAKSAIEGNVLIQGDLKKVVQNMADQAKRILATHPQTPLGVHNARKEFDELLKTQGLETRVFGASAADNSLSVSAKAIRDSMNEMVAARSVNVVTKDQLKKQSLLFDSLYNMYPKALAQSNSRIGRIGQNIMRVLPFRSVGTQVAATLGVAGGAAYTGMLPIMLGIGGVSFITYKAGKMVMSGQTKQYLGTMLKLADRAITSTTNKQMIKQLRLDRAAIVELLSSTEVEGDSGEKKVPLWLKNKRKQKEK